MKEITNQITKKPLPESTNLEERLEFYNFALNKIQNPEGRDPYYICSLIRHFNSLSIKQNSGIESESAKPSDILKLYPELFHRRTQVYSSSVLWVGRVERIIALSRAIKDIHYLTR